MDAGLVRAIAFLVSNSVEGLTSDNVVVVDTNGNLLLAGSGDASASAATALDNRRTAEMAVAAEVQKKVKSLLDTALGSNRSVVQVNVNLNWSQKEITKQEFDPTPQAVRSAQQLSESYTTDGQGTSGVPGATTNLPTAVPGSVVTAGGNLLYTRVETTNNYEITNTSSKETILPGDINRLSLSVLVDGVTDPPQDRKRGAPVQLPRREPERGKLRGGRGRTRRRARRVPLAARALSRAAVHRRRLLFRLANRAAPGLRTSGCGPGDRSSSAPSSPTTRQAARCRRAGYALRSGATRTAQRPPGPPSITETSTAIWDCGSGRQRPRASRATPNGRRR